MDPLARATAIATEFEHSKSGGSAHEVSISSIISNLSRLIDGNNSSYFVHADSVRLSGSGLKYTDNIEEAEKENVVTRPVDDKWNADKPSKTQSNNREKNNEKKRKSSFLIADVIEKKEKKSCHFKTKSCADLEGKQYVPTADVEKLQIKDTISSIPFLQDLSKGIDNPTPKRLCRTPALSSIMEQSYQSSNDADSWSAFDKVMDQSLPPKDLEIQEFEELATEQKNEREPTEKEASFGFVNSREARLLIDKDEEVRDQFLKSANASFASVNNSVSYLKLSVADLSGIQRYFHRQSSFPINNRANDSSMFHDHTKNENGSLPQDNTDIEDQLDKTTMHYQRLSPLDARTMSFAKFLSDPGNQSSKESIMDYVLGLCRRTTEEGLVGEDNVVPLNIAKSITKASFAETEKNAIEKVKTVKGPHPQQPASSAAAHARYPSFAAHIVPQGLKNNLKEARKPLVTSGNEELPVQGVKSSFKLKGQPKIQCERKRKNGQLTVPSEMSVLKNNLKETRKPLGISDEIEELPVPDVKSSLKLKGQPKVQCERDDAQSTVPSQMAELKNYLKEARKPLVASDNEELPVLDVKATLKLKGQAKVRDQPEDTQSSSSAPSQVSEAVESFQTVLPSSCPEGNLAHHHGAVPGGFGLAYPVMIPVLFPMPYPLPYYQQQNGQIHANSTVNPFSAHMNFSGVCHHCGQLNSKNDEKPV